MDAPHGPLRLAGLLTADDLPRFYRVKRATHPGRTLPCQDPGQASREAARLLAEHASRRLAKGARVAITAGSRGFAGYRAILRDLSSSLAERGFSPVLVPAMGSHGGGTVEGQLAVLAGLGIEPDTVPAAISRASPSVAVARTPRGRRLYCHETALAADAVVVVNRVKPHTAFDGAVQSGLVKMLAVGLGGPDGAAEAHRGGAQALEEAVLDLGEAQCRALPVLGAVATVEDAAGAMADLRVATCPAGENGRAKDADASWRIVRDLDARCLELAVDLGPHLPVEALDLLLVDWMGKDVAGTGLDPKVVGRRRVWDYPDPARPAVRRIVVFRLTPASSGNANGVGLADVTTRRLAGAIDWDKTLKNVTTTTFTARAVLPPAYPTDLEATLAALASLWLPDPRGAKVMRIRDTRHLAEFWVSEALLAEQPGLGAPVAGPMRLPFGEDGDLTDI